MTAACEQAAHKASGLGGSEGEPVPCEERDALVPCGARQGDRILPLRVPPVVVVLGHVVVADIAAVDDFAPHIPVADGAQRRGGDLGVVHAQAGADMVRVLKESEEMVAPKAYPEGDILIGKVLYANGIGEDTISGQMRVHVGVQLLHEIESQHIVVVQARGEEPIVPRGILLAYLPIQDIEIFVVRAEYHLDTGRAVFVRKQPLTLIFGRLLVCQEQPCEVLASLLQDGWEAVLLEQIKAVVQPYRLDMQRAIGVVLQVEAGKDDVAIGHNMLNYCCLQYSWYVLTRNVPTVSYL